MKNLLNLLVVTFLVLCGISSADAYSMYLDNVRAAYPNIAGSKLENCNICHNPDYSRNGFGSDFAANGHNLGAIEAMDSDGDGFSNIAEINAVTFPGNASDRPAVNGGPAPAPTGGPTMAMPGSQSVFDIQAGIFPFISALPENAKPIGVGPVAEGGDYLSVQVGLNAFAGAVDLYFVITLPGDTDNLYFLNPDNSISVSRVQDVIQAMASNRFPAGVQPWKKGSAGPVNEIILNSIPVADIITGTYGFYLLASPSGSLDRYYLWGDIVEVSDLAGRGGASDQMGKPDSRYDIPYGPSVYPVISQDPFKARPIGVGPIADGGTVVSLQVGVGKFISPMDLYMAYSVPAAPDKIYFMRPDYSVTAYTLNEVVQAMTAGGLPAGLEPWKKNTKGVINEIIQNNVPETSVNPGTYSYFMLAFPSGLTDRFYRWGTAFQAEGGPAGAMDPFAPAPRSMDGVSLYNQNCSICHGGLAASSLGGSTANDIKTAVSTIGMMKGLQGLIAQQISAIANAIAAAFQPPPTGTDGAALYSSYCAGCHGPLETSAKSGRTSGQIQAAVSGNIGGMGSPALAGLTTAQFDAIAGVLAGQTPPPPPPPPTTTDGATLYTTYCSGCHGPLATSAKLNKTAAQIQGAINGNIGGMGSPALMSLTPTQVGAIATALVAAVPPPPPPPPVTDGPTLYTTYCSGCHGPLATSAKLNKTAAQIQGAINGNIGGMGSPALMSLTPTQVGAIATALVAAVPPPPPPPPVTDGPTLYTTYCSGCHGPLATSAKLNKTAAQIQGAINGNIGGMGSPALMSLTPTQVSAIATALVSATPPPPAGPYHPANWYRDHRNYAGQNGVSTCTACHGADLRGGSGPSCYSCHGKKW